MKGKLRRAGWNNGFLTRVDPYLILDSRNGTCLRTTGSYFFSSSLPVCVRAFFLVT